MIELPNLTIKANDDTVACLKVHRIAYTGQTLAYGSFVGAANAVKVLRAGLTAGMNLHVLGSHLYVQNSDKNGVSYNFRQTGIGHGYVHATLRYEHEHALVVLDDLADEWMRELHRMSTLPILPEWLGWLTGRIKDEAQNLNLTCLGCEVVAYRLTEDLLARLLREGASTGAIDLPECQHDMAELGGSLVQYVGRYAATMADSAGSLRPLFDPKSEQPTLPLLKRAPFTPQGWMIEGAKRCLANS